MKDSFLYNAFTFRRGLFLISGYLKSKWLWLCLVEVASDFFDRTPIHRLQVLQTPDIPSHRQHPLLQVNEVSAVYFDLFKGPNSRLQVL